MIKITRIFLVVLILSMPVFPLIAENTSGLRAGNPTFNSTAAEEEGYWYSRYNLGNLVMRSGLGDTFMPDMQMIKAMVKMADANPLDGDTAIPPKNPALLKTVYASASPRYITKFNPKDYGSQRWNPASFDKTITTEALGWTIIKESEWGKQFHVDEHFGTVNDNFGAQWRFAGLVLVAEAKMQAQFALTKLKNYQGLITNSDGKVNWNGQWVFLEALSDLGHTLSLAALPHSTTNRYRDLKASQMFLNAADNLFTSLTTRIPSATNELSLAIQSLVWYASATNNVFYTEKAKTLIDSFGNKLINTTKNNATERAYAVRGLIEAYRVTENDTFINNAAQNFNRLSQSYSSSFGYFIGQNNYTIDDIAVILGAINSTKLFAGDRVNQKRVEQIFTGFFESAVNLSGLQQSAPPKGIAKGKFEQYHPDIYYAYPGIPIPPKAGGKFGTAPVFGSEIKQISGSWKLVNPRFNSAGAMHASNEFIWFHNDEVNGFPELK